jgi:transcriptional regulator with XRE-family HTH domain
MARPAKPIDESTYAGRFAARLRTLREKAGLTGEQMAQAITEAGYECATRTYYAWEASRRDAPINALPAIARVFGVKIRTLFPDA